MRIGRINESKTKAFSFDGKPMWASVGGGSGNEKKPNVRRVYVGKSTGKLYLKIDNVWVSLWLMRPDIFIMSEDGSLHKLYKL